jgi:hypothetical protein
MHVTDAAVLRVDLLPKFGARLSPEDRPLRVDLSYSPPTTASFPAGSLTLSSQLDIDLEWTGVDPYSDEVVEVEIGYRMSARLLPGEPPRLLAVFGVVEEVTSWERLAQVVGESLRHQAAELAAGGVERVQLIEIESDELSSLQNRWNELLAAENSVRSIPDSHEAREWEVRIVMSAPMPKRKVLEFIRDILEDESERPPS